MSIIVKNKKAGKINKYGVAFFDIIFFNFYYGVIFQLPHIIISITIKDLFDHKRHS